VFSGWPQGFVRRLLVAPVLVATKVDKCEPKIIHTLQNDRVLVPIECNAEMLRDSIHSVLLNAQDENIDPSKWESGRYCPTPTIIEAAIALYNDHSVKDISRSDATAINLSTTSDTISRIIGTSKQNLKKSICFVTGVPGAGKTLVGLNIATSHMDPASDLHSVFLSGNGPLVLILREALTRNTIHKDKLRGEKTKKTDAMRKVAPFIQNIHHFRDDCLENTAPPREHVVLFDEAQRAWDLQRTASFMRRKKNQPNFRRSEPEFLIECLDRHNDWAVIVCLIGGGQEINTGEAGISEWIASLNRSFPHWNIYVSSRLADSEYGAGEVLKVLTGRSNVTYLDELHLSVSMRSFRSEYVSALVKYLLDLDVEQAANAWKSVKEKYPIVITRDLSKAKYWLKEHARGSERYGTVVSSQAERLRPHAINVRSPIDPRHWFLDGKQDVRSSYYLEDVATEFHVQGLELDWACVVWDADFRRANDEWEYYRFVGKKWHRIKKADRKNYLKNAYRVLLTRARQGMVIVVPNGDLEDSTRSCKFYYQTFEYLKEIGFPVLEG
jgi:hypothetical protein